MKTASKINFIYAAHWPVILVNSAYGKVCNSPGYGSIHVLQIQLWHIIILNLNFQTLQTVDLDLIPFHVTPSHHRLQILVWKSHMLPSNIFLSALTMIKFMFYRISSFVTIAQFQCWGCKRLFLSIIYRKQVEPHC